MDVLEGYLKRLCISGAADRIAALQDQICGLTAQLADHQTTLYYSEAARERLAKQLAQAEQRAADRRPPVREHDPLLVWQLSRVQSLNTHLERQNAQLLNQAVVYRRQIEQQRAEIADLNVTLLAQTVTQAVKRVLESVPHGANLLHWEAYVANLRGKIQEWEAYAANLRGQIQQGTAQATTLKHRIKQLQQQLDARTPRTIAHFPPQKVLAIIQRPENQHRPLLAALNLPGTPQATVPLDLAHFSVRNHNLLKRGGIATLNDLLNCTAHELLQLRNAGPQTLQEIEACVCALWPHLPPQYFQRTVIHRGADDWTWRFRTQYGRPRY